MYCLIKFNNMNFCPRLSYASWIMCQRRLEANKHLAMEVFFNYCNVPLQLQI